MRDYIFGFPQSEVIKLDLKLNELLILDYMFKFFNSAKAIKNKHDKKYYYRLTYKKILEDLPILKIRERQLRNILINLELKCVIKRLEEQKGRMFISVDFEALFGKKLPYNEESTAINCRNPSNKLPTIDNYNNKKILYISCKNNARDVNYDKFNSILHGELQLKVSSVSYEMYLKDIRLVSHSPTSLTFKADYVDIINKHHFSTISSLSKDILEREFHG